MSQKYIVDLLANLTAQQCGRISMLVILVLVVFLAVVGTDATILNTPLFKVSGLILIAIGIVTWCTTVYKLLKELCRDHH